ncbi:major facilitator superfamily domain-containing protein [Gorgonomyces haynaldii]|nr:major facilitator superfamily domain-containing protein [Gorgonomyces haynaldii]
MSYSVCIPVLPYVLQDSLQLSVSVSAHGIGILLMSPFLGIISDRTGRPKLLLMISSLLLSVASTIIAFIPNFWAIFVTRLVQGAASATIWAVSLSIIAEKFKDNLGATMGIVFACYAVGQLLAPAVAGVLYDKLGYPAPFLLITGLSCLALFLQTLLDQKPSPPKPSSMMRLFGLLKTKSLLLIMTMLCFNGMILAYIDVFVPLYMAQGYQYDSTRVGLIMLGFAIPSILFSTPAGYLYDKIGFKTVFVGITLVCLSGIGQTFAQEIVGLLVAMVVMAIGLAFGSTPFMAEISHCAPKAQLIESYGLFNIAFSIGLFLGPIIGAPLYDHFGWKGITVSLVIMELLSLLFGLQYKRPDLEEKQEPMSEDAKAVEL